MKNLIFLLSVILVLAIGAACKKTTEAWPTVKNTSGSNVNVNPGDSLDSVAVFTVAGSTPFPANTNTNKAITGLQGVWPFATYYYFTVSFQVFAANDINYTTPLYTSTYQGKLTQKSKLDSNALQVVLPIHYNHCIQRSLFLVSYTKETITSKAIPNPAYSTSAPKGTPRSIGETDTSYVVQPTVAQPPGSGAEANGSGGCETFAQGKTADGKNHMIFSQTGSDLLD